MKKDTLFNNGKWAVSFFRNPSGKVCVFVESLKTGFCDYPIKYDNGQWAWDYPERVPLYVKRIVRKLTPETYSTGTI